MNPAIYFLAAAAALIAIPALAEGSVGVTVTDKVKQFAGAIAFAEGFWDRNNNVIAANRPARNNNPGDFLGVGDLGAEGGYAKYSTLDRGWMRLYLQLNLIVNGGSTFYSLDESISDMAYTYTATEQDAWSENVASYLGVSRDTPLRGLLT